MNICKSGMIIVRKFFVNSHIVRMNVRKFRKMRNSALLVIRVFMDYNGSRIIQRGLNR